jgi:hypothetical protein
MGMRDGKVVIITGAATGIGRASAVRALEEHERVSLGSDFFSFDPSGTRATRPRVLHDPLFASSGGGAERPSPRAIVEAERPVARAPSVTHDPGLPFPLWRPRQIGRMPRGQSPVTART